MPTNPPSAPGTGETTENGFPRRICLWKLTPAETAIVEAMRAVELMGCSVHLTDAVTKLGQARDHVADFVDGLPERDTTPKAAAPAPDHPTGETTGDALREATNLARTLAYDLSTDDRSGDFGKALEPRVDLAFKLLSALAALTTPRPASEGSETALVTRFEVIDHRKTGAGRSFVANAVAVDLSYQDDGRTLKVFVNDRAALPPATGTEVGRG